MRLFKYNEVEYGRQIYEYGFLTNHRPTELRLLVLYLRDVLHMSPKMRETELLTFCNQYLDNFSMAKDYILFDKALRKGLDKKQRLILVKKIPITKEELDYIASLEVSTDYKKILFAFLVQNKLNKEVYKIKNNAILDNYYFSGGCDEYGEIKEMSNADDKLNIHEVIHDLSELGYINLLHTGKVELVFLKNISQSENIIFDIEDYENCGLYFDYYTGSKRVGVCPVCRYPFYKKSNSQIYCKNCTEHPEEYHRDKEKELKVCRKCGHDFYANGNRQKYCLVCSPYRPTSRVEKVCLCGKKFYTINGTTGAQLCPTCREKRNKKLARERYLQRKLKKKEINA